MPEVEDSRRKIRLLRGLDGSIKELLIRESDCTIDATLDVTSFVSYLRVRIPGSFAVRVRHLLRENRFPALVSSSISSASIEEIPKRGSNSDEMRESGAAEESSPSSFLSWVPRGEHGREL